MIPSAFLKLVGGQQHLWNNFDSVFPTEIELASAAILLGALSAGIHFTNPGSEPARGLSSRSTGGRSLSLAATLQGIRLTP